MVLFVLPLVAYLFFASGVNNFGRLPVLTEKMADVNEFAPSTSLEGNITILGFPGSDQDLAQALLFNLNQKIYKQFYEFYDFQMLMVFPQGMEEEVEEIKSELGRFTDTNKWKFIFVENDELNTIFMRLNSNLKLDDNLGTPNVFIIDKDVNLRGRADDEDEGIKYGFNATSVAELNNKMVDDVKIILAEYRLALKKNNADRNK